MTAQLTFSQTGFSYDSMAQILFSGVDLAIGPGWTGVVGANGAGKSTFLKLSSGLLTPDVGAVTAPDDSLYAEQRTDTHSAIEREFFSADDGEAWRLKGLLGIEYDWLERWDSLSHGERKRMQIGASLWKNPALLAVDEPTNHLDGIARKMVFEGLKSYQGVGLLVSHDRELLDTLTIRTIIISEGGIELRQGCFTSAWEERQREIEEMRDRFQNEKRQLNRLKKDEARRRRLAEQQHARRSKRGIPIKDHDARFKKNLARISGKDGVGGKLLRQMDGRLEQAESRLNSYRTEKKRKMGISVNTTPSQSDALFSNQTDALHLGDDRYLYLPRLTIEPCSRTGITGPNGSGKSTLVRHIMEHIHERFADGAPEVIYIPQEIQAADADALRNQMHSLPKGALGQVLSVVSRLGTLPDQLLGSAELSPGESRKLMLALGIHSSPSLIVMDEPTNHMDIPSVECIEAALAETECALLLVSHDTRFLEHLVTRYWRIEQRDEDHSSVLRIELVS